MSRKIVVAGNWKENIGEGGVARYIGTLEEEIEKLHNDKDFEVVLCVPFTHIDKASLLTKESKIKIGAQDVSFEKNGAHTGDVSIDMLKEVGAKYIIAGHSERRQTRGETDEDVNKKIKIILESNLTPIACIGETLEQRENGVAKEILTKQTKLAVEGLERNQVEKVIIAYEPIWAIGTGKTATSSDANETIGWIRQEIANLYGEETAEKIIIQYGGSVKPENAEELFAMENIDGGLVGGASLKPKDFALIVNGAAKAIESKNFIQRDEER